MKANRIFILGQRVGVFLLAIILISWVAACTRGETEISAPEVEGPALVMFYTDG